MEIVIHCVLEDGGPPPPPGVTLRLRPLPTEEKSGVRGVRGWTFGEGQYQASPLRPEGAGVFGVPIHGERPVHAYIFDRTRNLAAVVRDLTAREGEIVDAPLSPAGTVVVPQSEEWAVQTVRVRDASGTLFLVLRSIELPVANDRRDTLLLLPAGAYTVSAIPEDAADDSAHRRRIVVAPGETVQLVR
jgi:hypothetical protein